MEHNRVIGLAIAPLIIAQRLLQSVKTVSFRRRPVLIMHDNAQAMFAPAHRFSRSTHGCSNRLWIIAITPDIKVHRIMRPSP